MNPASTDGWPKIRARELVSGSNRENLGRPSKVYYPEQSSRVSDSSRPSPEFTEQPDKKPLATNSSAMRFLPHQRSIKLAGPLKEQPSLAATSTPSGNTSPRTRQYFQGREYVTPHRPEPMEARKVAHPQTTNNTQTTASTQRTKPSMTRPKFRKIVFQADVILTQKGKGLQPGRVSIHQFAKQSVAVFELIINQGRAIRKDIRELLAPFIHYSDAMIRWQDISGGDVGTGSVQFEDVTTAETFEKVVNDFREKHAGSKHPIFKQVPDVETHHNLKPTIGTTDSARSASRMAQVELHKDHATVPRLAKQHDVNQSYAEESIGRKSDDDDLLLDFEAKTFMEVVHPTLVEPNLSEPLIDLSSPPETATATATVTRFNPYLDELREIDQMVLQAQSATADSSEGDYPSNSSSLVGGNYLYQHSEVSKGDETAFMNMKATDPNPFTMNLTQDAQKFLHGIPKEAYEDMFQASSKLVKLLDQAEYLPPGQSKLRDFASFQIARECLRRFNEYDDLLLEEDKQIVLKVVHAIVFQGHNRIVRPRRTILNLRDSQGPCPEQIREFNIMVKTGNYDGLTSAFATTWLSKKAEEQTKFLYGNQSQDEVESSSLKVDGHTEQWLLTFDTKTTQDEPSRTSIGNIGNGEDKVFSGWDTIDLEEKVQTQLPASSLPQNHPSAQWTSPPRLPTPTVSFFGDAGNLGNSDE